MKAAVAVGVCALLSSGAYAQNQASGPAAFEVVSVRENTSPSEATSFSGPRPGRLTATNFVVLFLLHEAFGIRAHQLIGAPDWVSEARYDITATYPPDAVPQRDMRPMLQRLLAERFGLVTHSETREVPVYNLVMARSDGTLGPRLTRSNIDCEKWLAENPSQRTGQRTQCMWSASRRTITARTQSIATLLGPLQSLSGRPVVDRTGLTGTFNVDLEWTTSGDLSVTPGGDAAQGGVSLFAALQEQLGLKLEPSRAPFEVIVIDAIRRPTPD